GFAQQFERLLFLIPANANLIFRRRGQEKLMGGFDFLGCCGRIDGFLSPANRGDSEQTGRNQNDDVPASAHALSSRRCGGEELSPNSTLRLRPPQRSSLPVLQPLSYRLRDRAPLASTPDSAGLAFGDVTAPGRRTT